MSSNDLIRPRTLKGTKPIIRHKQHIDYEFSSKALLDGYDLFFSGIRRQTAHYAAKKLTKLIGQEVFVFPMENSGEKGYAMITKKRLEEEKSRLVT